MTSTHITCPTHSIRAWDGRFWKDASLSKLGLVLNLGHGGKACSAASPLSSIWVGHLGGFSEVNVRFCLCGNYHGRLKALQLLEIDIFPCSDTTPQSGFTIALLRQFGIFSTLGKGSTHKFYAILERSTSTGFPGDLPDRSRELQATHRRFSYLLAMKRSGLAFPKHPIPAFEDDLALRCPACPNPDVNFRWGEVSEEK